MSSLSEGSKKWVTKLSSAGLVYLHFGHRVLSTIAGIYVMYVRICVCVCVCVCMYVCCEGEWVLFRDCRYLWCAFLSTFDVENCLISC